MKIKTLLITAIGGDIAQSTAKIIKRNRPDIMLIGIDMAVRHAGKIFVDKFIQVPSANDPQYLSVIKDFVKKFDLDVILPMSEAELPVFLETDGQIEGCPILHCGSRGLNIGLDKLKTNHFLQSIQAPFPWTILAADAKNIELPCIFKPRLGSGSKGVCRIENQLDFDYFKQRYPEYIFQELLEPNTQEVTCAVYRTRSGKVHVLQMLRELSGDSTGWAVTIDDDNIKKLCIKVADELEIVGSINIQLINNENGPFVFEINPRISSTAAMRDSIGFKDVVWMLNEFEGEVVQNPDIRIGKIMLKTCSVAIVDS